MSSWTAAPNFADRRARIDGKSMLLTAELLHGGSRAQEVRYVAVDGDARVAHLHLTLLSKAVRPPAAPLPAGTVLDVFTVEDYQRHGIAPRLWTLACGTAEARGWPQPVHSPSRTALGERFARKVHGTTPDLHRGHLVRAQPTLLRLHLSHHAKWCASSPERTP